MSRKHIGLWIDHEKAFIVLIVNDHESLQIIESNVGRHVRLAGGSRSATIYGPQDVASESQREAKYRHKLDQHYTEVIDTIRDADAIVIMGPGEAKTELKKAIDESPPLAKRIREVIAADKMTQPQLMAKVRTYFHQK